MRLTLAALYQRVANWIIGDITRLITVTLIIIAANIQCCSDSGGYDKRLSSTMIGLGKMPSLF